MSIINNAMYLPTMQTFIEHWAEVNEALGSKPLILPGGFTLADFIALRISIQNDMTAVTSAESLARGAHETIRTSKKALMQRLGLFRKAVLGELPDSIYTPRLPTLPPFTAGQTRFVRPLEIMAEIWNDINIAPPSGFTAPLVLADGTTLEDFQAALASLYTAYSAITTTEQELGRALSRRDALLPAARKTMKQYRIVLYARIEPGDWLLTRLPRLSPKSHRPPKPVTHLVLTSDAMDNTVNLTFAPAPSKNISRRRADALLSEEQTALGFHSE